MSEEALAAHPEFQLGLSGSVAEVGREAARQLGVECAEGRSLVELSNACVAILGPER